MPENSILATIEIIIQDYEDNKPVVFSDLVLTESLASVNNFSFSMRPASNSGTSLNAIVNFKKEVLGKNAELSFKNGDTVIHKFKGVILEVASALTDQNYYEFILRGTGVFGKVNQVPLYQSFYKKKLDAIIDGVFQHSDLKNNIEKNVQNTKELHYIVQYDQTAFEFIRSLATRFGEWIFYDGEKLQFGKKPEGNAVELVLPNDVSNVNIKAHAIRSPNATVGTDIFKSETIEATTKEEAPGNDIIKVAASSGSKAVEEPARNTFISTSFTQETINDQFKLEQQALLSSSVIITGNTRNTNVSIGKILKIKDNGDDSGKNYIVTHVEHAASNAGNYWNSFTAVPAEVNVPPYTDPLLVPKAASQAAVVTDNEDDAGLARIKVKFAWMKDDEKTPWISVLTPHAGKDKGFRFIPEVEDEVIVDFWGGNAELPFVKGAIYTEKNKPDIAEKGNHLKLIGSRTGRRFVIDDDKGEMYLRDYNKDEQGNKLQLIKNDSSVSTVFDSGIDSDNYSKVQVNAKVGVKIEVKKDGESILEIVMNAKTKEIKVMSKGDISISAEGAIHMKAEEINLNAGNINIKADTDLKMDGKKKVEIKGMDITAEADANLDLSGGAQAKLNGPMLDLKGDGIATLAGGLVKIN